MWGRERDKEDSERGIERALNKAFFMLVLVHQPAGLGVGTDHPPETPTIF
jgi:hypothetical protein